jgi:phosphotransacetylase
VAFQGAPLSPLSRAPRLTTARDARPPPRPFRNKTTTTTNNNQNKHQHQQQRSNLFDRHIDARALVARLERLAASSAQTRRVTPKMFMYRLTEAVVRDPQHVVLPEGTDARVLAAAAEATARGLARVTLLGDPAAVHAEASKLGLDVSRCAVVDPATSDRAAEYAELYTSIRSERHQEHHQQGASATAAAKPSGRPPPPTREASLEAVRSDVNLFGVMMVRAGAADGMVSGAAHTTAATVRPAMQVLKRRPAAAAAAGGGGGGGEQQPALVPAVVASLVSSVFFMCLPDRVLVFGDCAVNVSPTAEELAAIAVCSADTALAFGIEPRVAMLSYSTLGSGAGPEVERVAAAAALVKAWRPDLAVEGPLQYDAALDEGVAKLKVKVKEGRTSEVAGRATVLVFPDLNSGNTTYKAVQRASPGCVAMGPVLQNLSAPVNDLSRGCTVNDIVATITITGLQAQQAKRLRERQREREQQGAAGAA